MKKRKDKAISVHADVHELLEEAKTHFEGITKTHMTWSAYLYALACGALAVSSFAGLKLRCPLCGEFGMQMYYSSFEEPGAASGSEGS